MTPDEELIALRRQVADLTAELEEYRRRDQPGATYMSEARARCVADDLGADSASCKGKPLAAGRLWGARAIALFIDHPEQMFSTEQLLPHLAVRDMNACEHRKTVHVAIFHARAILKPHGLVEGIENIYGDGYRMTRWCAAALKARLAQADARRTPRPPPAR